jgi:hypothetical protein
LWDRKPRFSTLEQPPAAMAAFVIGAVFVREIGNLAIGPFREFA